MYCRNCGKFLNDEDKFCKYCGNKIIKEVVAVKEEKKEEKASIGWWFLAFFIPFLGVILYFVYRKSHPHVSKKLLFGIISSFIGAIVSILIVIVLMINFYNNGFYVNYVEVYGESGSIVKTTALKLYDSDEDSGDFIIYSNSIHVFGGSYYEFEFGGSVTEEETFTSEGEWARLYDGSIKLITYQTTYRYNYSGEGAEAYVEELRPYYETFYGQENADKFLSGQKVEFKFTDGMVSYVVLNEEDKTFIEYLQ